MKGKSSGSVGRVEDGGDDDDGGAAAVAAAFFDLLLLPLLLLTLKPLRLAVSALDRAPSAASVAAGTEAEAPISKGRKERKKRRRGEEKPRWADRFLKKKTGAEGFISFFDGDVRRKTASKPHLAESFRTS
jgi:hypothetical protein